MLLARSPDADLADLWKAERERTENGFLKQKNRGESYPVLAAEPTHEYPIARWIAHTDRVRDMKADALIAFRVASLTTSSVTVDGISAEMGDGVVSAMSRAMPRSLKTGSTVPDLDQVALLFHLHRLNAPTRAIQGMFNDVPKTSLIAEVRTMTRSLHFFRGDHHYAGWDIPALTPA